MILTGVIAVAVALAVPTSHAAAAAVTSLPSSSAAEHAAHLRSQVKELPSGRYKVILAGPSQVRVLAPVTFSTKEAADRYVSEVKADLTAKPAQSSGVAKPLWSINLPCPVSCGADSSGGDHLWVIANYQSILNATVVAALGAVCLAYLGPIIQGWAVPACSALVYLLKVLSANEPRVTNHGVWAAVYFTKAVQGGRY
jgi:hypothetical protein